MKPALSIVIPALNEAAGIEATLQALQPLRVRGVELVLADGGSSDATQTLARLWVDAVVDAPRGRASQMNAGAARARADAGEVRQHLLARALTDAPFLLLAAVEGHHQVVLFAAAQRVMHQMAVRPDPDGGGVPAQVGRHLVLGHHRAVHHMAGHPMGVAHHLLAHHRTHAIGADHRRTFVGAALGVGNARAVGINLHLLDLG